MRWLPDRKRPARVVLRRPGFKSANRQAQLRIYPPIDQCPRPNPNPNQEWSTSSDHQVTLRSDHLEAGKRFSGRTSASKSG